MENKQRGLRDFVKGMASALDIGGTLAKQDTSCNHDAQAGWKADAAALTEDWRAVGRDIRKAIDRFGEDDAGQNRKKTDHWR